MRITRSPTHASTKTAFDLWTPPVFGANIDVRACLSLPKALTGKGTPLLLETKHSSHLSMKKIPEATPAVSTLGVFSHSYLFTLLVKAGAYFMKWYPYGHDFGNAEIGGVSVIGGTIRALSIPTAFAKVDTKAMRNLGINVDQPDMHIIQFSEEEMAYAVGDLALQQAVEVYHGRGDIQRYASKYSLRGLLTIAATLIPDPSFGLYVVAGLPAETFMKNSALRSTIKAQLDGTYQFVLNDT